MSLILDGTNGLFGNVTGGDISGNFIIDAVNIPDGSITESKIANNAVTESKIANNAVTESKIAPITATGSNTARSLANRFADVVNVKDFGAVGNGIVDDTVAIQIAINSISSKGGIIFFSNGTFKISSTISIPFSNIILQGNGADFYHDIPQSQGSNSDTIFLWSGASGGTMIFVNSPSGATLTKQSGCGIRNITFQSNGTAGSGLIISSQNSGIYENLLFNNFSTGCVTLNTIQSPLADARDPQRNIFINVCCVQTQNNGFGFFLGGDQTIPIVGLNPANVSMNEFRGCDVFFGNGNAYVLQNSDRNVFYDCRANRVVTGATGAAVIFSGSNSNIGCVARSNVFIGLSVGAGAGEIIGRGTTSFTYPSYNNNVLLVDDTNSTPEPTVEPGSSIWWSSDNGVTRKFKSSKTAIATTVALASEASNLINNESLRVHSNTADHIRFSTPNSLNEYGLSISPNANPDLHNFRLSRLFTAGSSIPLTISGTGAVAIGNFLYPIVDNTWTCGQNGNRWSAIWAANGVIQTSDEREKTEIITSQLGLDFINKLNPVSYKWKSGGNKVIETNEQGEVTKIESTKGERTHFGLLAQEVKKSLPDGVDFGGWILTDKENPNSQQALRYDQFIAPLIKAIQELSNKIDVLEHK